MKRFLLNGCVFFFKFFNDSFMLIFAFSQYNFFLLRLELIQSGKAHDVSRPA